MGSLPDATAQSRCPSLGGDLGRAPTIGCPSSRRTKTCARPRHAPATRAQFDAWNALRRLRPLTSRRARALGRPPPAATARARKDGGAQCAETSSRGGRRLRASLRPALSRRPRRRRPPTAFEIVLVDVRRAPSLRAAATGGGDHGAGATCADGGAARRRQVVSGGESTRRTAALADGSLHRGGGDGSARPIRPRPPRLLSGLVRSGRGTTSAASLRGGDAYVVVEPCAMARSGGVHSRIRRVMDALGPAPTRAPASRADHVRGPSDVCRPGMRGEARADAGVTVKAGIRTPGRRRGHGSLRRLAQSASSRCRTRF